MKKKRFLAQLCCRCNMLYQQTMLTSQTLNLVLIHIIINHLQKS